MFEIGDLVKFNVEARQDVLEIGRVILKHVREGVVLKVWKTPNDFIDPDSDTLVEVLWIDHQHMTQRYYDTSLTIIARANK